MLGMKTLLVCGTALGLAFNVAVAQQALADEGMWTFDNLPLAKIKQDYGVSLDQTWVDNVQASAVRLSVGCSASVVSPDGLVLTNHHCVLECAQDLSSAGEDHVTNGFTIDGKNDEKSCPGLDAEILTDIVDETTAINTVTKGLTGQAFVKAFGAKSAELEKTVCGDDKALRCQVISFYQGGQYKLYKYHKYTDVRLAFAPEFQAAFFGGDPDNFNFPRYALDVGFLRLYENGQPIKAQHYLKWNPNAPKEGELTFVAGNPGTTERLLTSSQLESRRDVSLPGTLITLSELRGRLIAFSETSPEARRIAKDELFGVENSFKAYSGEELALVDPKIIVGKKKEEMYLKSTLKGDFAKEMGDPWADMAAIQVDYRRLRLPYSYLDRTSGDLLTVARTIVRGVKEREKASADRLPEFADSRLPGVETRLFSAAPIEKPLEKVELEFTLSKARENLTADSSVTKLLLGAESPEGLAKRLVDGTRLDDIAVRKSLWNGTWADLVASTDPMIQYAIRIDDQARAVRSEYEAKVSGPAQIASQKIAKIRFKAYGTSTYPDATFSLRLSYGKVSGWTYNGTSVPAYTYMGGLFDRATGQEPFDAPPKFLAAKDRIDPNKVYDFVTTNDIVGGNSGSPVFNAKGEVIGAAFDGNILSLGGSFAYDGSVNRCVVVSTGAITEALDKVYDRKALVAELLGTN